MSSIETRFGRETWKAFERAGKEDRVAGLRLYQAGPLAFVEAKPAGHIRYVLRGSEIARFRNVDGLGDVLAEALIDIPSNLQHIYRFLRRNGDLFAERRQIVWMSNRDLMWLNSPGARRLLEIWEPPHFEGRRLALFAESNRRVVRVVLDADSYQIDVEDICIALRDPATKRFDVR